MLLPGAGLLEHESNTAVAGGINVMLSAETTASICQLQALSPVGRCRTFDARYAWSHLRNFPIQPKQHSRWHWSALKRTFWHCMLRMLNMTFKQ